MYNRGFCSLFDHFALLELAMLDLACRCCDLELALWQALDELTVKSLAVRVLERSKPMHLAILEVANVGNAVGIHQLSTPVAQSAPVLAFVDTSIRKDGAAESQVVVHHQTLDEVLLLDADLEPWPFPDIRTSSPEPDVQVPALNGLLRPELQVGHVALWVLEVV